MEEIIPRTKLLNATLMINSIALTINKKRKHNFNFINAHHNNDVHLVSQ